MKQYYFAILLSFAIIKVYPVTRIATPPLTATISGTTTVCQNAANPQITFTGGGGTAPYTFTYHINGGSPQTVITSGSNISVTVTTNTSVPGSFIYSLDGVQDATPPNNVQAISGQTALITITVPPTVDFLYTNNNACSGTNMQFTSSVSGTQPANYSWDFGDGSPNSTLQNPVHQYNSVGCGTSNYTVILTVSSNNCIITKSHIIAVKQKPDISFSDILNPFDPFSNCSNASSNPIYSVTVGNVSTSTCISSFTINWGDSNIENNAIFPASHTYNSVGAYTMVITANGINGCVNSKSYIIKNVSNPLGGINSPGSTQNLCAPTSNLQFAISNWGSNSLDTTYSVNYGDGTTGIVLTQNQLNASTYYNSSAPSLSANYPIPHVYTTSSCPAPSFQVELNVTNACGTTPFTLGNISILTKPTANFINPPSGCANTSILFTNTTVTGYSQNCAQTAIYTWNFGDGTPVVTTVPSPPANISHIFTVPGTYTVTLTAQNFCGTTTKTQQICIESPVSPQFNINTNTGCAPLLVTVTNNTNLTNQCSTPTYSWAVSYTSGNCGSTPSFTYTGGTSSSSSNPVFNFNEGGTYSIALTATNSCGVVTSPPQIVTIKKPPTVVVNSIPNFCQNINLSASALINNCSPTAGATTYLWSFPGGTPSSATTAIPPVVTYATSGSYSVALAVTNECGTTTSTSNSFTVSIAPIVQNVALTICSGSAFLHTPLSSLPGNSIPPGTTYSWTSPVVTGGITGGTSGTNQTSIFGTLFNPTTTIQTATYTVTPKVGNCPGNPFLLAISVNPAPLIVTQPTSSTVCVGGTPQTLTVVLNSSAIVPAYQWYVNTTNTMTGGTLIPGATNVSYTPPSNLSGILYYYCVLSFTAGGCTSITSNIATVAISPVPTIAVQPQPTQTVCTGGNINAIAVSYIGGVGIPSYQWFSNTVNSTSGGTAVGGNTSSYTPPTFLSPGNYYYYVTISLSGNGCGTSTSNIAEVIVVADPVISLQPIANQTQCQNSPSTPLTVNSTGGAGTLNYQWYSVPTNTSSGGTPVGGNSPTFTPPTTAIGVQYYYCTISQTGAGCAVNSAASSVVIVSAPQITTQPQSSTICLGGTPAALNVTYINGTGIASYQWFNTSGPIAGANGATFTPPAGLVGSINYYCVITFSSGGCTSISSTVATVTISPNLAFTTQPQTTQTICAGGTVAPIFVNYSGGVGTPTYQWYSNTVNSTSGGTMVGSDSSSYSPTVFGTPGTYFYYVTIALSGNGCGTMSSNTAEIIVVADPTINTQPIATQTQCQNAASSPLVVSASGGTGSFLYQWYSVPTNINTGGTPIGGNSSTFTAPTSSIGTFYYYCLISQTGPGCSVATSVATVNVVSAPFITAHPQSSSVCIGGTPSTLSVSYNNGTGTVSYQWYNTAGAITGATNPTFTPTALLIGAEDYYCIITFSSGGCTSITSNTATITVNSTAIITTQPQPTQSLCEGGNSGMLTVSYIGGVGIPTYQWYSNITNSTSGGTPIGTNSPSFAPPLFSTAGSYFYYVTITLSGNGCGAVTSNTAEIIVLSDPIITIEPLANQTQCENSASSPLTVAASGGLGTYNYQWYSVPTNLAVGGTPVGSNSPNFIAPTSAVGTFYYYCTVSQSGAGCEVKSSPATVVVVSAPQFITQPQSSTVCIGGLPTPLTVAYSNGTGTATYQWYDNSGLISGATSSTFIPTASILGTTNYYCVVSFSSGGCTGITSNTAVVTINPLPTISSQPLALQSICIGGSIPSLSVTYNGGVGSASYHWYSTNSNASTGGIAVGTDLSTYTPPPFTTAGTFFYYVIVDLNGNGCGTATSSTAEIQVLNDPLISAQPLATQTLCQNASPSLLSVSATGGVGTSYNYQWFSSATSSTTGGTAIVGEINSTFLPPTSSAGTIYYYCTVTQQPGSACNVTSDAAEINVNLAPAIVSQPLSSTICVNQAATILSVSYINGAGSPIYQWYLNNSNTNIGGAIIVGANGSTYIAPTSIAGTSYYYCEITFPLLSGGCQTILSNSATVTVNDNPVISGSALTICSATTFIVAPLTGSGNIVPVGTTYTWNISSIVPVGSISGATPEATGQATVSQTLINSSTSQAIVSYTVTPTSGVCQGSDFIVTVTVNPAIDPHIMLVDNQCFGVNTASITTNVTGGIPFSTGSPYLYSWTGPNGFTAAGSAVNNLAPGNYGLTILDAGGCPFSNTYTITEPADIVISNDSESDISCFGTNDGAIAVSISGGTGNYSFIWTRNGNFYSSVEDLTNLPPGIYMVTVTDVNNCGPKNATFTISEPPLLVATLVSQTNILCYGAATGAIDINVTGGTIGSGYNYMWNGPNGFISSLQNLTSIVAGNYNLSVSDANGCVALLTVTITQSTDILIAYTTTPITCYGANNASISVTLSGGNGPYQFQWDNLSTSLSQLNLDAGNYTITVTDIYGCIKTQTINIPQAPIFMSIPIVSQITCFGAHNGSINLNLTGGMVPVALSWADGSTAGLIRNNLGPGTYTATISDGTPCYITQTFTIVQPQPISLTANLSNAFDCTNAASGSIDLIPSGGTPPYQYLWSNGATTQDLINITEGNYLVNVRDANGCTSSGQFNIIRQEPLVINVVTQTDFDCELHTVEQSYVAHVSGGFPPYVLQWSSGVVSGTNNEIMQSSTNGSVVLTVTDNLGCAATYSVVVNNPVLGYPTFEPTSIGYSSYGIYSIGDPIRFNSTVSGDYVSIYWDFGDGTFSNEVNPTHTYLIPKDYIVNQVVTYPFGCVYKQTISLIVEQGYMLVVPNAFTPNHDTLNDHFRPVTKRLKNVHLDVYDTWGSIIYSEIGDVLVGWDGKIKGNDAENGNYYSKVSGETFYGTTVNENHPFVLIK